MDVDNEFISQFVNPAEYQTPYNVSDTKYSTTFEPDDDMRYFMEYVSNPKNAFLEDSDIGVNVLNFPEGPLECDICGKSCEPAFCRNGAFFVPNNPTMIGDGVTEFGVIMCKECSEEARPEREFRHVDDGDDEHRERKRCRPARPKNI